MNSSKNLISNNVKGGKVLFFFTLSSIVYAVMIFVTIPKLIHYSNGLKILDMKLLGYSYLYVSELFTSLGIEGRNFYLNYQIPIDLIYPFLFGLSNYYVMTYFLQKIDQWKPPYLYLSFLPIFAALFDYFENIGIILLLRNYPNITYSAVQINSFFTISKSVIIMIFFIALIFVLIRLVVRKIPKTNT